MTTCHATRSQDEMHCTRCRLRWDVNDPEPPACRTLEYTVATRSKNEHLDNARGYVSGLPTHFLRGSCD